MRSLSAYTENDLIVGLFTTREKATNARTEYITRILETGDNKREQCYMTVDLEKDLLRLMIYSAEEEEEETREYKSDDLVYFLFEVSEGFGQVCNGLVTFSNFKEDIIEYAKDLKEGELEDEWPSYYQIEQIKLDQIRYENSEREDVHLPDDEEEEEKVNDSSLFIRPSP